MSCIFWTRMTRHKVWCYFCDDHSIVQPLIGSVWFKNISFAKATEFWSLSRNHGIGTLGRHAWYRSNQIWRIIIISCHWRGRRFDVSILRWKLEEVSHDFDGDWENSGPASRGTSRLDRIKINLRRYLRGTTVYCTRNRERGSVKHR
jgi:hypothetical protein